MRRRRRNERGPGVPDSTNSLPIAVQRAAADLVRRHGASAAIMAAQRVAESSRNSDRRGAKLWLDILRIVNELLSRNPPS